MTKITRNIIKIDEEKCNGCGLCIPACPEGALQIINGKAVLVKESFCDGLGACLGDCPEGALMVIEEDVDQYDAESVIDHLKRKSPDLLEKHMRHLKEHEGQIPGQDKPDAAPTPCACPGSSMRHWQTADSQSQVGPRIAFELRQWPVQLHLVPPAAPYFKNAEILIVADCVPFAYPNFHQDLLKDKAIAVGCPKLDDVHAYLEKITQIITTARPKSITVAYMEVPCCTGLVHITKQAIENSGQDIPFEAILITIKGDKLEPQVIAV